MRWGEGKLHKNELWNFLSLFIYWQSSFFFYVPSNLIWWNAKITFSYFSLSMCFISTQNFKHVHREGHETHGTFTFYIKIVDREFESHPLFSQQQWHDSYNKNPSWTWCKHNNNHHSCIIDNNFIITIADRRRKKRIQKAFHLIDKHSFVDRLLVNSNLLSDDNKNAISTEKLSVVYIWYLIKLTEHPW